MKKKIYKPINMTPNDFSIYNYLLTSGRNAKIFLSLLGEDKKKAETT